jgi:hypothetical protein
MDEQQYYKLLHGKGQRHQNTNLLYIPHTEKTVEERSLDKICPPPQLNPNYKPNKKVQRCGKLAETSSRQPQTPTIDPAVLRRIFGK